MKAKEIRDLTSEEQAQKLAEVEKELFNLRLKQTMGQLDKPDQLRLLRRDVARIKTVMNTAKAAR